MIEIKLKEENFLAKGGERTCFIHPLQAKQIIKVIHSKDKHNNQNELEYQYYKHLQQKNVDFSHIAQCHGWVETNQGKGLSFDRIIDYNGKNSKYFRFYLRNKILSEKIEQQLLDELKLYLEKNQILFVDVSTVNLFCQEIAPNKFKLVIFDGLGARRLGIKFYFYLFCKVLVKYKIKKQWFKFLENYQRDKTI